MRIAVPLPSETRGGIISPPCDRRECAQAAFREAVHRNGTRLEGIVDADIVILATPVRTIVDQLNEIAPTLWPGTIVMDMGSTKGEVCAALDLLPAHVQPIGGHPMTGKETAGFEAAEPNLYRNATWVLSPLPRTTPDTVALATELVEAVGARPVVLTPERHDRLVAAISHLPFLAASALVHTTKEMGEEDPAVWQLAAGGFRDTSRVAASDTRMFLDILMTNQPAVLAQLENYIGQLNNLRDLLEDHDEAALATKLASSQAIRAQWKPNRS